jgi:hypothetical protein
MNPLIDEYGAPIKRDPVVERAYLRAAKRLESEIEEEDWKVRHPILAWCNGKCWEILRNAIGAAVGVTGLVGSIYAGIVWLGWPNYVTNKELHRELSLLDEKTTRYFTNLQRMAWVTRVELLQSRLTAIGAQRAEFEDAISLHQREIGRKDTTELERDAANRRIRTLRVEMEKLEREELKANQERDRYVDLLDKSASGPIGPTDVPPPPEYRRQQ